MAKSPKEVDSLGERLMVIDDLLRGLFILECAKAGMTKAEVREIVGGDVNKITRIWKYIRTKPEE